MRYLKNITPEAFRCVYALCPAVYSTDQGDELYIVGKKVEGLKELGIAEKVGEDEQVVMVDREMLRQLFINGS